MTREGISTIFMRIKALKSYGVTLLSYQEVWLETLGEMADIFIALLSWVADFESQRRSERTKAGNASKNDRFWPRGPDKKKRKTRVIKRPEIFTSESQE